MFACAHGSFACQSSYRRSTWKSNDEFGSTIDAFDATRVASVMSGDLPNQGQPQTTADIFFGIAAPEERFKDAITISCRNAGAGIGYV